MIGARGEKLADCFGGALEWAGLENANLGGLKGIIWYYESLGNHSPGPHLASDSHQFVGLAKLSGIKRSKSSMER